MGRKKVKDARIKVICESCIKELSLDCILCQGHKFYFWDPVSCLCYSPTGEQIFAYDENGEALSVARQHSYSNIDLKTMLNFIELWVQEDPVRKWNLHYDENGWQGCIWFNRYKKKCSEFTDHKLEKCVKACYQAIIKSKK